MANSVANSVDPDQTAPIGAVCSGSMLFASFLMTDGSLMKVESHSKIDKTKILMTNGSLMKVEFCNTFDLHSNALAYVTPGLIG